MLKSVILTILSLIFMISVWRSMPDLGTTKTEILWDSWGVPHIYGQNQRSLFEAFGWAQTHSHGNLLLKLYGESRGKASEYWGINYLANDQYIRMMGIPERAKQWYQLQSQTMQDNLEAFAQGINRYVAQHPQEIPAELQAVLPITGVDVVAHGQRVLYFEFLTNAEQLETIKAQTLAASPKNGSNAWAIAPSKSQSNKALLLANPHLPWSRVYRWYEAQLTAPGINVYGATLVGMPVPAIAFNDDLGWSLTLNDPHNTSIYELTLQGDGYLWNGEVRPFESQTEHLKIRQSNGGYQELEWEVRHSVQGVVIAQQKDHAYALRVPGLDRPYGIEQFWQMAQAQNLASFEAAWQKLQIPLFNVLYSDHLGNIFYLYNAIAPKRAGGTWQSWHKIQAGDTDKTLWTEYLPYEALPKLLNPKSGWLQNTNDPPWTSTLPSLLDPQNYPLDLAPPTLEAAPEIFRTQRSLKIRSKSGKSSLADLIKEKFSTRLEMADRILHLLIPAANMLANPIGIEAAAVLKKWDHQANADSKGAVLFMLWAMTLSPQQIFSKPWQADNPLQTPSGLANINIALAVLEGVAAQTQLLYGKLDVTWGEVVTMEQGKYHQPAIGAPGELGSLRVLNFKTNSEQKYEVNFGDSYIAAIAFSDPIQAQTLLVYGNASQPQSPHLGDQLSLYGKNQLRPVWRQREEILAHLELQEVLK